MWSVAPLKDRDLAKTNIAKAKSVNADKYAKKLYEQADADFKKGQDLIVEDGKSSQNDEAKKQYLSSNKHAEDAYQKSINPYYGNILKETETSVEKAQEANKIAVASPEFYEKIVSNMEKSKQDFAKKKYKDIKGFDKIAKENISLAVSNSVYYKAIVDEKEEETGVLFNQLEEAKAANAIKEEYEVLKEFQAAIQEEIEVGNYRGAIEKQEEFKRKNS